MQNLPRKMPWRILVVTQVPELAELTGRLVAAGHQATHATESWAAVRRVLRDRKNPALIVLDTSAPRARDFLSARTAIADLAQIPVVVVEADGAASGAPSAGAPPDGAQVIARVDRSTAPEQLLALIEEICGDRARTSESGWTPPLGTTTVP